MSIEGSAPTIFNVDTRQFVINAANKAFMNAAKLDWQATGLNIQDKRNQVILETASAYTELDKLTTGLKLMRQQELSAQRMEQITGERVQAGVDAEVVLAKAEVGAARVRMPVAQTAGGGAGARVRR